jgi:hypothetical protein
MNMNMYGNSISVLTFCMLKPIKEVPRSNLNKAAPQSMVQRHTAMKINREIDHLTVQLQRESLKYNILIYKTLINIKPKIRSLWRQGEFYGRTVPVRNFKKALKKVMYHKCNMHNGTWYLLNFSR